RSIQQSPARGAAAQGGVMGKVAWGFTASIDGFIAGPGHDMSWLSASEPNAEGTTEVMASNVAVIISGRRGYDAARAQADERDEITSEHYGGALSGTQFVLTRRPESHAGDAPVTAMKCTSTDADEKAQRIAGDRDIQIISADIAWQALEVDLIDELQVYVAPVFLGDGTRIFDVPGGRRVDWELAMIDTANARSFGRTYRPKRSSPR